MFEYWANKHGVGNHEQNISGDYFGTIRKESGQLNFINNLKTFDSIKSKKTTQ
jgi:hypothetical protein